MKRIHNLLLGELDGIDKAEKNAFYPHGLPGNAGNIGWFYTVAL